MATKNKNKKNTNNVLKTTTKTYSKYKLLCPRGTQTCALAVANIAHAVYLLDVAKRPIPQG